MATQYEIFLESGGGYAHVATKEAGSARSALDQLVKDAEEFAAAAATLAGEPEAVTDTSGSYLVVPTTNATFIRRYKQEVYTTEEHDPIHDNAVQQEMT